MSEWQGNPLGPRIPQLEPRQELALLARILYREGYDDHLAGHITYEQPDGTLLATPFGLTWDEMCAGDIMRMDQDGNTIEGPWTITPAILLHTEIHKIRDDATVIIHNHSRYGTTWADLHRVPPVYDQTGSMVFDDLVLYEEFEGVVATTESARKAAEGLGNARCALLANHGVVVVADAIDKAYHRGAVLEWRCRMAWQVEAIGAGVAMPASEVELLGGIFDHVAFPGLWEAMVRRELRRDPSVLSLEPTSYDHLLAPVTV